MRRQLRIILAGLALVSLLLLPGASLATGKARQMAESEPASPVVDAVLMRPLGLAGLGMTAILWVPTQAMHMLVNPTRMDKWNEPVDYMLKPAYEFVFVDPLGSH